MASIPGFIKILEKAGHRACIFTVSGVEMKLIRTKAARFIFDQSKRAGEVM